MQDFIYAQILKGIVQNVIVLNDPSLVPLFQQGFDFLVDVTQNPVSPGWSYDGKNFSPPPPIVIPLQQILETKVQNAIDGFNSIMISYVASNIMLGITQAGKTQLIADTLSTVMQYGQSGSLFAAITALQGIQLTPEMAPFLTPQVVQSLIAQAQAVIAAL